MIETNYVSSANEFLKQGKFTEALELYEAASSIIGEQNFKWNIDHCKEKLGYPWSRESGTSLGKKINEYFDNIYLVNLKSEKCRLITSSFYLKSLGINFELFEAVNGYKGDTFERYTDYSTRELGDLKRFKDFKDLEIKRGKPFIESAGAIGYIYTYIDILKDATKENYRRILILEDDILFSNTAAYEFDNFITNIGDAWKILQLGASQYNWDSVPEHSASEDGFYHPRQLHTCGSFAIAFDHSIYEEVITAVSAFESPFDHLALGEIYERHVGKCFVCYPNIVMPDVGSSSIRDSRDQASHSVKMRWNLSNFPYPLRKPAVAVLVNSTKNLRYISQFEKRTDSSFILKLYANTIDGLRPVHNPDLLEQSYNALVAPLGDNDAGPEGDFITSIDESETLTESDIFNHIANKLLTKEHTTNLKEWKTIPLKPVMGRASVIIPTYKRPTNLRNALNSVVNQDYHDLEIVVVSDNSIHSEHVRETSKIIDEVRTSYPNLRIEYIQHYFNRNGAAARNSGLLRSTGEFISFLDDDDIYLPGRISKSIAKLQKTDRTTGAVYCGFIGWNSPSNDENRYKKGNLTKELLTLEYTKHYLHTNTTTYKRKALLDINGFDETYRRHQDIELNLRFFEQYEVDVVTEALVQLNPEPSTVSNKVFNTDLLELKNKFLSQFDYLISAFDDPIEKQIYSSHWNEVARYITEKGDLIEFLRSAHKNGYSQTLFRIAPEDSQLT